MVVLVVLMYKMFALPCGRSNCISITKLLRINTEAKKYLCINFFSCQFSTSCMRQNLINSAHPRLTTSDTILANKERVCRARYYSHWWSNHSTANHTLGFCLVNPTHSGCISISSNGAKIDVSNKRHSGGRQWAPLLSCSYPIEQGKL